MQRPRIHRPLVAILAILAFALAACGGGNTQTQAESSTPPPTSETGGTATQTPTGETTATETGSSIKVAILTPGSTSDNGYNADAARTQKAIEDQLGLQVALSESVDVANQADVYRQFASQGYDLVIGWGGQFTDGAVEVAPEFPNTDFLVVNSNAENGSNLGSLDTSIEDWQFMAGWLAAKLSKSGTIGWVGALCFPATAANLHGTEQGAKYANPDIKVLSTFTGDFEDPTVASQAAKAMIENGADVLTGNLNNGWAGVTEAAKSAGIQIITEWADNSDTAPDTIVSSVLKSQAPFVIDEVKKVMNGNFEGKFTLYGLPADWGPVLSNTSLLDDSLYQQALDVQAKITSGEIKPKHDESCPKS